MENKKNTKKVEFQYINTENAREKIPILRLKIVTPYKRHPDEWLEAFLDTGYDGGLLIPPELYKEAELHKIELPIDQWDIGETVTGEMTLLQASLAKIEIKGFDKLIELRIETFKGNQEVILGLNGIRTLLLCLNGPKKCVEI